jgi:hypothetical protein
MKNINDKEKLRTLLREYIENVILTEDYGGDYDLSIGGGGGGDSTSGWGQLFGSMMNVFVVATGKFKEMLQVIKTGFAVSFEWVFSSMIPFLKPQYREIFEKHRFKLNDIKQKYASAYQASSKALGEGDAQLIMFMANPTAYLTGPVLKKAPSAAIDTLDIMTGGKIGDKNIRRAKSIANSIATATVAGSVVQNSSFRRNDFFLLHEKKSSDANKRQKAIEELKNFIRKGMKYTEPEYKDANKQFNNILKQMASEISQDINKINANNLPPEIRSKLKFNEKEVGEIAKKRKMSPEKVKEEMLEKLIVALRQNLASHFVKQAESDLNKFVRGKGKD